MKDSFAAHLSEAHEQLSKKNGKERVASNGTTEEANKSVPGVFSSSTSNRLSILNGSHLPLTHEDQDADTGTSSTVLVFPDFTAVCNVENSKRSAEAVWTSLLDPAQPRFGSDVASEILKSSPKTFVLPYECVILLCTFSMLKSC